MKGIRRELEGADFAALIKLKKLEELVLDCDQAPTEGPGVQEMKWGLQGFPEGMEHLVNMTHLTLSCHPAISQLPESLSKLSKLQVPSPSLLPPAFLLSIAPLYTSSCNRVCPS